MANKVTALEAKRYLAEVSPSWKAFWFHKGPAVRSLAEMSALLPKMPQAAFDHHVNAMKNDLERWVRDVVGDAALADSLKSAKTQKTAAAALAKRVKELQKNMAVAPKMAKVKA